MSEPAVSGRKAADRPAFVEKRGRLWAATHPSLATVTGQFLANCNIAKPREDANDPELARRLWEVSEKIVAAV